MWLKGLEKKERKKENTCALEEVFLKKKERKKEIRMCACGRWRTVKGKRK